MSELQSITSLMELASADTSDLKAQVSRLPNQGIYIVDIEEVKFTEQAPKDPADPMNFNLSLKSTILAFMPLEEGASGEGMEGRNLNERYFLYGQELQEGIQLLMGRYKQVGFRHKGTMGGVEGAEPGWIDEAVGQRIAVRVRHYPRKDGSGDQAAFDWLGLKAMEKNEIDWSLMNRPFLDEYGQMTDDDVNDAFRNSVTVESETDAAAVVESETVAS